MNSLKMEIDPMDDGQAFPEPGLYNEEDSQHNAQIRETAAAKEKRLMDAIAARKQVEKDAELLKNRIALLQMEERKARKKIEETKKRTSEVVMLNCKLNIF